MTTTDVDDTRLLDLMAATNDDMKMKKKMSGTSAQDVAIINDDRKSELLPCWTKGDDKHFTYTPHASFQMISVIFLTGRMLRGYAMSSRHFSSAAALGICLSTLFASGGQKRVCLWSGWIRGLGSDIGNISLSLVIEAV